MIKNYKEKRLIFVKTQFVGLHNWPTCTLSPVEFLKNKHRHVFHVEAILSVEHNERQLEFFYVKSEIDSFIHNIFPLCSNGMFDLNGSSCETIAKKIADSLQLSFLCSYIEVRVFEDNECGASYILQEEK